MEKVHCDTCNQPTFHQTTNAYGNQIHCKGIKCLTCGGFSGEPSEVGPIPPKALWHIENAQAVKS